MLLLLREKQMDVYRLISEADNVDGVVLQLIDFLLISLGHSESNVRTLAALCFGELGAIDPGLFRYVLFWNRYMIYWFYFHGNRLPYIFLEPEIANPLWLLAMELLQIRKSFLSRYLFPSILAVRRANKGKMHVYFNM